MSWPPYWLIAAASAAGSSLIAELLAGGNTIFWAASWLCTSVLITEWPQSSIPPPIARTTASTRPAMVASASNVLLRISNASLHLAGPRGPAEDLLAVLSFTLAWLLAAEAQVTGVRDLR